MGSGSSRVASLARATEHAEKRIGAIAVKGRYHRLPMRLEEDYAVDYNRKLGTGLNGAVHLAHRHGSNERFAVKTFKFSQMGWEQIAFLKNEVELFLSIDHPKVARLVDVYESESQLSLVMECMDGGELFARVKNQDGLAESDAAIVALQMLLAVNYMHTRGLVHRDLKLENFMYEREGADDLKIIDFGFGRPWNNEDPDMHERLGTIHYVAPEVLNGRYTSQCDLWSLGVIVFMILSGCRPFQDQNAAMQGRCTFERDRWANVSEAALDFVQKLLTVNPAHRLTAAQALEHPWLEQARARQECRQRERLDESIAVSLNEFAKEPPHKRKLLELMAWLLTPEERADVSEAFLVLDKSNTGVVRRDDIVTTLNTQFAVPIDECHAIFEALDSDQKGHIAYSQFLAAMMASRLDHNERLSRRTFERFDADRNEIFTLEEHAQIAGPNAALNTVVADTASVLTGANAAASTIAVAVPSFGWNPTPDCFKGIGKLFGATCKIDPEWIRCSVGPEWL